MAGLDKEPSMTAIGVGEGAKWGLEVVKGILDIVGEFVDCRDSCLASKVRASRQPSRFHLLTVCTFVHQAFSP